MMSSISLFDIISAVVLLDPQIFLCIPASATVNPNGIKAFLANGLITFFINGSPVFNNEPLNNGLFNNGPNNMPRIPC